MENVAEEIGVLRVISPLMVGSTQPCIKMSMGFALNHKSGLGLNNAFYDAYRTGLFSFLSFLYLFMSKKPSDFPRHALLYCHR
jgi:hypothetical protein